MQAKEIMTKDVITIKAGQTVDQAARLLSENRISGLPVVDQENRVIGIISEGDLVFQQKKITPPVVIAFLDGILQLGQQEFYNELKKIAAYKVEDIMTSTVTFVAPETGIDDIATLMINNEINRVPVLDENKKLLGIITRHDIIKNVYNRV
ncbi:MAG: CBS domain-containing protein [Bacillota bacterium]